eukprot:PITA_35892
MASSGKIEIEKFNGQSFELWKLKMEDLLVDKVQWIAVDLGTKPTGVTGEEWKKLDRKAKSTIRLCVSDSVMLNVSGEATAKALWDKLGTLYQSKSLVNKLFLRKKLLLCSLPDSWDSLVIAIVSNATALQFDEIVLALLTEEMRRKNMDNQNGGALSGSDDAPSAEAKTTSDEGGDVYLASSSTHVDHEAWLIDSGASFHFTPHREWFCEYEQYDGGDVFLGDDRKARIIGRGKVKLKLQGGRVRTLPGVLHIPALARNLISVSKLDDAGVKTVFEKETCKMVQGALVLMRGVWIGTLYKLQGSTVVDGCNSSMVPENGAENLVVSGEKTMLWHQRLDILERRAFEYFMVKNRVSFPSGGKRTKQILELVHSDVFGPVKVPSLQFKALVENQTEKKIKVLRTDNGGEICSKEFEEFCKKCGIARQKTTPYTPQQNGVAERMNKTLMERARSILSGAGLGQEFWAEAVDTACYLVNRSPSSALEDKTPQEVWPGKKPSLSHLRVFGCDAYVHVPKEN